MTLLESNPDQLRSMARAEPKVKGSRVPLVAGMKTAWGRLDLKGKRPEGIQFALRDDLLAVGYPNLFRLDPDLLTRLPMGVNHPDGELALRRNPHAWEGSRQIGDQFSWFAFVDPDARIDHLINTLSRFFRFSRFMWPMETMTRILPQDRHEGEATSCKS